MDFKGQYYCERFFQILVVLFGIIGFVLGYLKQDFRLTFFWLASGGGISAVVRTRVLRKHLLAQLSLSPHVLLLSAVLVHHSDTESAVFIADLPARLAVVESASPRVAGADGGRGGGEGQSEKGQVGQAEEGEGQVSKKNPWTHEQRASGANVRGVCSTAKVSAVTPSVLWRTAAVVRACAVPHAVPERRRVCRVGLTAQSDADVAELKARAVRGGPAGRRVSAAFRKNSSGLKSQCFYSPLFNSSTVRRALSSQAARLASETSWA